jgi:NhaP-type Na+/H+ or K+/H+ antiporter
MSHSVGFVVKWSRFALDLTVVFLSRIGAIGLLMMAGSLLIYAILGYATGHHGAAGGLAARLEAVVFAVFFVAMILFAIGCTLQQRDLHKVRREVGEVWWRGPG